MTTEPATLRILRRAAVLTYLPPVLVAVFLAGVSGGWFGVALHDPGDMTSGQAAAIGGLGALVCLFIIFVLAIVAPIRRASTVLMLECLVSLLAMFSYDISPCGDVPSSHGGSIMCVARCVFAS
jgi:hypothetical protein